MSAPIRTVRVSGDDWAEIERRAAAADETVSAYLRRRALEPDTATRRDLELVLDPDVPLRLIDSRNHYVETASGTDMGAPRDEEVLKE